MVDAPAVAVSKDRSVPLVIVGVLVAALGVLSFCFGGLSLFSLSMPRPPGAGQPPPLRLMVPSLLLYFAAGVFFVWTGVGAVLARRWARALLSAVSRLWLAAGLFGGGFALWLVPRFLPTLPSASGRAGSAAMPVVVGGCIAGCVGVVYVLLPGVLAWFFARPSVRATCERKDPLPRWTDRCPDSVLVLVIGLAYTAAMMPATLAMGVLLAFGHMFTGVAAVAMAALLAGVSAGLAVGALRLRPGAWWGMVGLLLFGGAAWSGFFIDAERLRELYTRMGMDLTQPGFETVLAAFDGPAFGWLGVALIGLGLGYLLWVRKYFFPAGAAEAVPR